MRLGLLFFICVLAFSPMGSSSPSKTPNKYTHLVNQLTMPYTNAIKSYRQRAETNLNQLRDYLQKHLNGEEDTDKPSIIAEAKHVVADQFEEEHPDANTEDENELSFGRGLSSERSLLSAGDCRNGGQFTTASVRKFICNGVVVKQDAYDPSTCTTQDTTENVCYCPYDFYGDYCEMLNSYTCDITRLNYPVDCNGTDGFDYVYSYTGVPPCYPVQDGDTIVMTNQLSCRFFYTVYSYEGVKPSMYQLLNAPTQPGAPFTYAVYTSNFRLTSMPAAIRQRLTFVNWDQLTNPKMIEVSLTADNLAGNTTYDTPITFDDDLVSRASFGRYYYELSIMKNTSSVASSNMSCNYYGGYFEQAGYSEPPPGKKPSHALLIALLTMGAIVVISAAIGYYFYDKKRNTVIISAETQPLVESH